jgi:hypothetical protein
MKPRLKYCLPLLLLFNVSLAIGQDTEMADGMRSEGKIYVVVSIILVVLVGLLVYLFMVDRKVSRLERRVGGKD